MQIAQINLLLQAGDDTDAYIMLDELQKKVDDSNSKCSSQ